VAILGGVLIAPMGRWTQWSWPEGELIPPATDVHGTLVPREGGEKVSVQTTAGGDLSPEAAT
jgi:hypothetical protein